MTAQIIEIAGQKMAVLPVAEYQQLCDLVEDRSDGEAAAAAEVRRLASEEYVPVEVVDRLMAGENALRVWRQYRGMTQQVLGDLVGLHKVTICNLEAGNQGTGAKNWRLLAEALSVDIEDIFPDV